MSKWKVVAGRDLLEGSYWKTNLEEGQEKTQIKVDLDIVHMNVSLQ